MAKVTLSDLAPDEVVRFNGWKVDLELGGSGKASVETDDPVVINYAEMHPWLSVEYPVATEQEMYGLNGLAEHPELDGLSGEGPNARDPFDPEKIKEVEDAKENDRPQPLAIDAGLDQGEEVEVGVVGDGKVVEGVAVTLAADEAHDPKKGPSRASKPSTTDKKGDE